MSQGIVNRRSALESIIRDEVLLPVAADVHALALGAAARVGPAVQGVLYYGSCLRTGELDGQMLDFYVLVDSYSKTYENHRFGGLLAEANRRYPPNVYYHEQEVGGRTLRCKYAILTVKAFQEECSPAARTVSVWARFAQPVRLVWRRDDRTEIAVIESIAQAVVTLLQVSRPLLLDEVTVWGLWSAAFLATYEAELRAEKSSRGPDIVSDDIDRYMRITAAALEAAAIPVHIEGDRIGFEHQVSADAYRMAKQRWAKFRKDGKNTSKLRLLKAAFTFDGGLDYLAWKVEKHSGTPVRIKPWHRRLPVIAGLIWYRRLKRQGAVH